MRVLLRGRLHGMAAADAGLLTDNDRIAWVGSGEPPGRPDRELTAGPDELIAPGFIDLQVNGFGGHDALSGPSAIERIAGLLPAYGVTGFLPTAVSIPLEEAGTFIEGARAVSPTGARVLGAHLEGPFLSPAFRGAHDAAALLEPTASRVDQVLRFRPRMITLAPELDGALEAAARLHAAGIVVAAGHSDADYQQGRHAIDAGVRFGTHVFNAMRAIHHRRPGIAIALLLDPRVTVGLIADGEHVHDAAGELAVRLKSPSGVALTTDQTAAAGAPAGLHRLGGRDVISNGHAVRLADGTLAGSAATMDELVRRMARLSGTSLDQAVTMASATPAAVLGESKLGRLQAGARADIVILDAAQRVRLTLVGGRVVYERGGGN